VATQPKCQFDNASDSKFCKECGTQLGHPKDIPEVTKTIETPFPQFAPGTSLADRYEIISELGKGGMGEVYLAEDTNLKRQVAIKVLPKEFALDKERLARFEREARVLASLNHPNIATIHGLEKSDDQQLLVMELVEGEILAEHIKKGPLPAEEALEGCQQIAEGLESAHEKGIIHRDLKPGNIKITPEGKIKILDFGLAMAFQEEPEAIDISKSPTLTNRMTQPGVILGTAAYMSPEQAKGKKVDKRTDIWAFGCILFECLTGKIAFEGETASETIASILKSEPDWEALPEETPWSIRALMRKCLQKDPYRRLHDIADARIEIEEALSKPFEFQALLRETKTVRSLWKRTIPWGLFILMAVTAGLFLWSPWREGMPRPGTVKRYILNLPPTERLWLGGRFERSSVALSPDGSNLVYVAGRGGLHQLYLHKLDQFEAQPIPGTEDARNPFFSPDGQWIAFLTSGKLKKVSLSSGASVTLCDTLPVSSGGSWGADDTILFTLAPNSGLSRVSASGGIPESVTTPDRTKGERGHYYPEALPGSKALLFTIGSGGGWSDTSVAVLSLETGRWHTLIEEGTSPYYLSTGYLVYARAGTILAVHFDLERLEVTGPPVRILEGVMTRIGAEFGLSEDGSLVYLPGIGGWPERTLVWVDRRGQTQSLRFPPRSYLGPRISPDGKRAVTSIPSRQKGNFDIWICELARNTLTRLTFTSGYDGQPIWTPDGKRVTFASSAVGAPDLTWKSWDGRGADEQLSAIGGHAQFPTSWSPNGRTLLFTYEHPETKYDIWLLPVEDKSEPQPWLKTQFVETAAVFSPDGRWIAYQSDETGRFEIYVKPFRGPGRKQSISTKGGTGPVWAPDGRELFYREGDKMMAVAVKTDSEFVGAKPMLLFKGRYSSDTIRANYDVSPDGRRFLMVKASEQESALTQINVVLNWFEELKLVVPTGK
jgi:serine/threonine-protein kinase